MSRPFLKSLRFRLHVSIILLLFVTGGVLLCTVHHIRMRRSLDSMEKLYSDFTVFVTKAVAEPLRGRSYYFLQEIALGIMEIENVVFFDILDPQGISFLTEEGTLAGRTLQRDPEALSQEGIWLSTKAIIYRDKLLGSVRIAISTESYQKNALRELLKMLFFLFAGLSFLGVLLAFAMERLVVRPILRLAHVVNEVGEGHFVTTAMATRKDEIGTLSQAFNNTSKKLEAMVEERTSELQHKNQLLHLEIQRREHLEEELRRMATRDKLTGILNRHAFEEQLARQHYTHRGIWSLIMFDLDNFKKINDGYGHAMGDMVLQKVTELTEEEMTEHDLFCRWGGEEFLLAVPLDAEEAREQAERIRRKFAEFFHPEMPRISASFGVAQLPLKGAWESTFILVDQRMYQAKTAGKNRVM